jgi:hypothetical protein
LAEKESNKSTAIFATLWLKSLWNVLKFSIAITANSGVFRRRKTPHFQDERERERERRSLIEKNN